MLNHFENGRKKALLAIQNIQTVHSTDYAASEGKREGEMTKLLYPKEWRHNRDNLQDEAKKLVMKNGIKGANAGKAFIKAFIQAAQ